MEEYPSGQRGQTVNLLALPSMVRIHPPPPRRSKLCIACSDFFIKVRARSRRCSSSPHKSSRFCGGPGFGDPVRGCRFSYLRMDETAALGGVPVARRNRRAFPQKSESILLHHVVADCVSFATTFFYVANVIAHSLRRSSFPTATRFAGLAVGAPPRGRLHNTPSQAMYRLLRLFYCQSALTSLLLLSPQKLPLLRGPRIW